MTQRFEINNCYQLENGKWQDVPFNDEKATHSKRIVTFYVESKSFIFQGETIMRNPLFATSPGKRQVINYIKEGLKNLGNE